MLNIPLFNVFLIFPFIFDQSTLWYNLREIFLSSDLNFSDFSVTVIVQWSEGSELTSNIFARNCHTLYGCDFGPQINRRNLVCPLVLFHSDWFPLCLNYFLSLLLHDSLFSLIEILSSWLIFSVCIALFNCFCGLAISLLSGCNARLIGGCVAVNITYCLLSRLSPVSWSLLCFIQIRKVLWKQRITNYKKLTLLPRPQ